MVAEIEKEEKNIDNKLFKKYFTDYQKNIDNKLLKKYFTDYQSPSDTYKKLRKTKGKKWWSSIYNQKNVE